MYRRFMRVGNRIGVRLYRATSGHLPGGAGKVLLLTVPGRTSGQPRSACVQYVETTDGLVVWGSGQGSRREPDWFRNLRAAGEADVRVGRDRFRVRAHELLGDERDIVWAHVVLIQVPGVVRHQRRAGRTIPVALITRT